MSKRILIIDDDAYIRDLYTEVLQNEGFDIETASDGQEGLTKLLEGGFAAVLLDVMLPKLDGIGILAKLKETPSKTPNGPILLLTNLDHDPIIERAKSLGAARHLIKADILPPMLVTAVREAMGAS